MCNAWNHPASCTCGWGGEGHLGRRSYGTSQYSRQAPATWSARDRTSSHETRCPVCGAVVYFVRPQNGGAVWFDELGWPWPKHGCMADSSSESARWTAVRQYLQSVTRLPFRFRPPGLDTTHATHRFPIHGCPECDAERTSQFSRQSPSSCSGPVFEWIMDSEHADPSVRWQAMRDIISASESELRVERARIEKIGWGAHLFAGTDLDEHRDGNSGSFGTLLLTQLRELGLDPDCEMIRQFLDGEIDGEDAGTATCVGEGEVDPSSAGVMVANGSYFGADMESTVDQLIRSVTDDGHWNCQATTGSSQSLLERTMDVLEGLLTFEQTTGGTPESREARRTGEEFLLGRHLFHRLLSGEPVDHDYLAFLHPARWHYDVLRAVDYFRASCLFDGTVPDARIGDAIEHIRSRRLEDGRWPLEWKSDGRVWIDSDAGDDDDEVQPSRWVTLRALRVLKWWENERPPGSSPAAGEL